MDKIDYQNNNKKNCVESCINVVNKKIQLATTEKGKEKIKSIKVIGNIMKVTKMNKNHSPKKQQNKTIANNISTV